MYMLMQVQLFTKGKNLKVVIQLSICSINFVVSSSIRKNQRKNFTSIYILSKKF